MNLFVMMIVEAYEVLDDDDRNAAEEQIPTYQEVWGQFDPDAIGKLGASPRSLLFTITQSTVHSHAVYYL